MVKKDKIVKSSSEFAENPMTVFCHFIYSLFGRNLINHPKFKKFFYESIYNDKYEEILRKANLKLLPEEYFISVFVSMVFTFVLVTVVSFILFISGSFLTVFVFYGGLALLIGVGIFMYNYPVVVSNDRKAEIDAAIPYLLPYLKILGRELNLSKIITIIDDFIIYKEIQVEFKKIKYYSEFLGYDIHSSIREAMASCPSRDLSDLMNDLVTISNSGGDIFKYLDRKLYNLNLEIDAMEKKNIDTLLIFSQIYVVILLIAPLFYTIMSSILNLIEFNADSGGGGTDSFISIFALLLFLPMCYVGFMMLVYYTKPLYSRLKPIDNKK